MKNITLAKFSNSQGEIILALLARIGGDGHTIWKESVLDDLSPALKTRFVRVYESDGSPKGSITATDGTPAVALRGVYGLDVLRCIAVDLGLPGSAAMGRGTEARQLTEQIRAHFAKLAKSARPDKQFRYMVKAVAEHVLLSKETFSYDDARTAAAKLGGIVTSAAWAREHCTGPVSV